MLKLGIYGDSFASDAHGHDDYPLLSNKAWFHLLKSDYDVVSHGKPGSSLFYSYQQFLSTHSNYDKIFFLTTSLERWPVPITDEQNRETHIPSYTTTIKRLNVHLKSSPPITDVFRLKLVALKHYFMYLSDDLSTFYNECAELMIDKIKQKRPDTIFVTFEQMFEYVHIFHNSLMLNDNAKFTDKFASANEKRCICHVSEEMNQIIYNDAKQSLINKKWIVSQPPIINHKPANYYYSI